MIQANELRLNNAVLIANEMAFITSICEFGISAETNAGQKYAEICQSDLFPLSLTAELLESFGFLSDNAFYKPTYWCNDIGLQEQGHGFKLVDDISIARYKVNLVFVHQLQNLFFVLTGTELTINLEKVKV